MWSYYTVKCENIYLPTFISLQKNVNTKLTEDRNCKNILYTQVLKWHVYLSIALIVLLSFIYSFLKKKKKKDAYGKCCIMLSFITLESWSFLSIFRAIINVTWANFSITVRFRVIFWWFDSV